MHMTRDCWKDFAASGSVSDFLKYREQERSCGQPSAVSAWIGGMAHGADDCSDRHDTYGNAGGRL